MHGCLVLVCALNYFELSLVVNSLVVVARALGILSFVVRLLKLTVD